MNSMRVCAIYLAAGQSSRMGENKLALPLRKSTIGSLALRTALHSNIDHVIIVTKQNDGLEWTDPTYFQSPFKEKWTLARCKNAALGQAHSLKCGLDSALKRNPDAIMVILADQPFLQVKNINELILLGEKEKKKIDMVEISYIAASLRGTPRPPILFFNHIIPLLLQLEGDTGARQLFSKYPLKGKLIEMKDENLFFDIDTKEDYEKAKQDHKKS